MAKGLNGTAVYTVPAGFVAVLRDLDAYFGGDIAPQNMFLHGPAGQAIWWNGWTVLIAGVAQWRGRQVIQGGESFDVTTDAPMDVSVSGYLLTLP